MRAFVLLFLSAAVLCAQTNPVRPIQHTNGRVVSPTNFWQANSNAINAVVPVPELPAWITNSTAAGQAIATTTAAFPRGMRVVDAWVGGDYPEVGQTNGRPYYRIRTVTNGIEYRRDEIFWTGEKWWVASSGVVVNESAQDVATPDLVTEWSSGTLSSITSIALPPTDAGLAVLSGADATAQRSALGLGADWLTTPESPAFLSPTTPATASAWLLGPAPTNGIATIAPNQTGVGWDDLGRFTLSTPVGTLQMYESGSPITTPIIYWNGTIVAQRFDAIQVNGMVYASQIVGAPLGGDIADSVMRASMPSVLQNWQGGDQSAGVAGVPYVLTNGAMWPVAGNYIPVGVVSNTGSDVLAGRWWDLNTLASNLPTPRSGAASSGSLLQSDGAGGSTFVASKIQFIRKPTNTTRSSWTNTNWYEFSPNADPHLSLPVVGGETYVVSWFLAWNPSYAINYTVSGMLTPTNAQGSGLGNNAGGSLISVGVPTNGSWITSPNISPVTSANTGWGYWGKMQFTCRSNSTVTVHWWQTNTTTNPATLTTNSWLRVEKLD